MERALEAFAAIQFLVIGLSHVFQRHAWVDFFSWLRERGAPGVFVHGFLSLGFGSMILAFHAVWSGLASVRFLAPSTQMRTLRRVSHERAWEMAVPGVAYVVLGALLAVSLAVSAPPAARAAEPEDSSAAWTPVALLVGRWAGEGSGFGIVSDVEHDWRFVVGGRFLELRTRSVPRGESGGGAEIHEDVGLMSHDDGRGAFAFRQFLSEGFVNTYDVTVERGPVIRFEHRDSEGSGGMRARLRLEFTGSDEYAMTLDLAAPGQDFAPCQRMRMRRARRDGVRQP